MKKILLTILALGLALAAAAGGALWLHVSKGVACETGEGDKAIEACSWSIKYMPLTAIKMKRQLVRSELYAKAGRNAEALADIKEVLSAVESGTFFAHSKDLIRLYENAAKSSKAAGNGAEVVKYADLAIKSGSLMPELYLARGGFMIGSGKCQQGLADMRKAVDLGFPELAVAYPLALAYKGLGDYGNAYKYFKLSEPSMTSPGERIMMNKEIGLACFHTENYLEALPRLLAVMNSGTDCPECEAAVTAIQESMPRPQAGKRIKRR